MPYLAGIFLYPIKSLDGRVVSQAEVLASGALKGDRQYALVDAQQQFVNAKRYQKIHRLRAAFDLDSRMLHLRLQDASEGFSFHLESDCPALETWLSDYFGFPVTLIENPEQGFPDDTNAPGPTVISTATLEAVASWFPGLTVEGVRSRMRANLEIGGVPAFWEDQLFAAAGEVVPFQIGPIHLQGINPCQRCIVPTRDALTGNPLANFQNTFVSQRQATLPAWAERSRFAHFYKLSLNTRIPKSEAGQHFTVGDEITVP